MDQRMCASSTYMHKLCTVQRMRKSLFQHIRVLRSKISILIADIDLYRLYATARIIYDHFVKFSLPSQLKAEIMSVDNSYAQNKYLGHDFEVAFVMFIFSSSRAVVFLADFISCGVNELWYHVQRNTRFGWIWLYLPISIYIVFSYCYGMCRRYTCKKPLWYRTFFFVTT